MSPETLCLDDRSIRPEELSMGTLTRELSLQQKPSWLLRKLMNALEHKRQAKGMGWSRPWNKTGLNVFRTHVQDAAADADYFEPLLPVLRHFVASESGSSQAFVEELLADPKRMVFTFYHNHDDASGQFEGLTISIGRRCAEDRTKRDRLDIILEDRRVDGRVDGLVDRLRIYVCPWNEYKNGRKHLLVETAELQGEGRALTQELFRTSVKKYHQWKTEESRQWTHWSARYIDYFGSRSFIPTGTSFS
jgi:hypothetical protein